MANNQTAPQTNSICPACSEPLLTDEYDDALWCDECGLILFSDQSLMATEIQDKIEKIQTAIGSQQMPNSQEGIERLRRKKTFPRGKSQHSKPYRSRKYNAKAWKFKPIKTHRKKR